VAGPKPSAATLIWEPAFAAVSAAGDMGYTTGPWELRPPASAADATTLHGHFISVWTRPPGGSWKVALDIGCGHAKPARGVGSGDLIRHPIPAPVPGGDRSVDAFRSVLAAEEDLLRRAREGGLRAAIPAHASPDVRVNREGLLPSVGAAQARSALAADTVATTLTFLNGRASRSGDMAVTHGVAERRRRGAAPDASVFVHIWRAAKDRWELALTVENPAR